jgi:hypothetical protein
MSQKVHERLDHGIFSPCFMEDYSHGLRQMKLWNLEHFEMAPIRRPSDVAFGEKTDAISARHGSFNGIVTSAVLVDFQGGGKG